MAINLIPPELKKEKQELLLVSKSFRILLVCMFVLGAVSGIFYFFNLFTKSQLASANQQITANNAEATKFSDIENNILKTNNKLSKIAGIDKDRTLWSHILAELARCTPSQVAIQSLSLDESTKTISMSGEAETRKEVARFKEKLESSDYFKNVLFSSSTINETEQNFTFSLTAELEKNK